MNVKIQGNIINVCNNLLKSKSRIGNYICSDFNSRISQHNYYLLSTYFVFTTLCNLYNKCVETVITSLLLVNRLRIMEVRQLVSYKAMRLSTEPTRFQRTQRNCWKVKSVQEAGRWIYYDCGWSRKSSLCSDEGWVPPLPFSGWYTLLWNLSQSLWVCLQNLFLSLLSVAVTKYHDQNNTGRKALFHFRGHKTVCHQGLPYLGQELGTWNWRQKLKKHVGASLIGLLFMACSACFPM